jgi:hypothetical protein
MFFATLKVVLLTFINMRLLPVAVFLAMLFYPNTEPHYRNRQFL